MVRFFKKKIRREIDIAISEQNGVRLLHLGGDMIQSAMKIAAPHELVLLYTQCMMSFLLFNPQPVQIAMIGLGGGSLAKFTYHTMPQTKTVAIENSPQVIDAARHLFALPANDDRFQVVLADGAEFIKDAALNLDILMVDGFDDGQQIAALCSQSFYDDAYCALGSNGILVVNLLSRDKHLSTYLQRINQSFQSRTVAMLSEPQGNLIVLAFKKSPGKVSWKSLRGKATSLAEQYHLPFADFVSKLRKHQNSQNLHLDI